jgi:predicted AAA+ superfamily ATPase
MDNEMPKPADQIAEPLTPKEVARYFELKEAQKELADLELRFKGEIENGEFPAEYEGETYIVKRWEQISTFKEDEFLERYNDEDFPELFYDAPKVSDMIAKFSPSKNPELFERKPDVSAVKEKLDNEDKAELFKQAQYLKITKKVTK